ncbi:unnamed protein product [Heligmosomoides polygyrus]|uniref:Couple_hipA domain-containing protein n=1 Tax=Heligmosomoides polygyrus TaxID=6339 RepID=A0A183G275_HELPZ|nr:unnamed protein product [Heligmosomoides polygyrus]
MRTFLSSGRTGVILGIPSKANVRPQTFPYQFRLETNRLIASVVEFAEKDQASSKRERGSFVLGLDSGEERYVE